MPIIRNVPPTEFSFKLNSWPELMDHEDKVKFLVKVSISTPNVNKPGESALKFSDFTEICMFLEGVDNCLHCYWILEAGHSRHDFT